MDANDTKTIADAAKSKMKKAIEHLECELLTVRAGKASVHVLDNIMVEYYGAPTGLAQVASITIPDARTILVQPWEKKMLPVIEKAILVANIGLTPQNNGETIRINVPPLTEERRVGLVKQVKAEGEKSRMSIRNIRRDAIEDVKKLQKSGLSEDIVKDTESDLQTMTDSFNRQIDEVVSKKEKEIMTV